MIIIIRFVIYDMISYSYYDMFVDIAIVLVWRKACDLRGDQIGIWLIPTRRASSC